MRLPTTHAVCLLLFLFTAAVIAGPADLHAQGIGGGAPAGSLDLKTHVVRVDVVGRIATTTIEQTYHNSSKTNREVVLRLALSPTAAVHGLAMWVDGLRAEGVIHPRISSKRIYREIRGFNRDPAVLESLGGGRWQVSVFPVLPKSSQKIQIVYSDVLPLAGGRLIYEGSVVEETSTDTFPRTLEFSANVRCPGGVADFRATSHAMGVTRRGGAVVAGFRDDDTDELQPISFAFTPTVPVPVTAAYRDAAGEGYFVTVLEPFKALVAGPAGKRNVVIVLDVSDSMGEGRLNYVIRRAVDEIERLGEDDRFAVIAAGSDVALWREKLAAVTAATLQSAQDWMGDLPAGGGTDLAGALRAAESLNTDPNRRFEIIVFSDGEDYVGIGGSGGEAARPAANVRLVAWDVSGDERMSRRPLRWFSALGGRDGHVRNFTPARREVSALRIEPVTASGPSGLRELAHTAIVPGRPIILAGRWREAGAMKVRISATIDGKGVTSVRTVALGQAPTLGAWAQWASPKVRRVWASLRAERLFGDMYRSGATLAGLAGVIAHSRTHHVATRATAMLVLESDKDYHRRGMNREPSAVKQGQSLEVARTVQANWLDSPPDRVIVGRTAELRSAAASLRREGRYVKAADKLDEIVRLEPGQYAVREEAALLLEFAALRRLVRPHVVKPLPAALSKRPWQEVLLPERGEHLGQMAHALTALRRTLGGPGELEPNAIARHTLSRRLPKLDFANVPLELVIQFMREVSGVSTYVNWRALQVASVDKTTEVNVHLMNVSLEKALRVILDDVSGAAVGTPTQVDFVIHEGVIRITTREALSHRTYMRVYDVRDILMESSTYKQTIEEMARGRRLSRWGLGWGGRGGGGGGLIGGGGMSRGSGPPRGGATGPPPADIAGSGSPTMPDSGLTDLEDEQFAPFWDDDWQADETMTNRRPTGHIAINHTALRFATEEFVDLLKDTVRRDTWEQDAAVRPFGGRLVITQSASGHLAVSDFFAQLRQSTQRGRKGQVPVGLWGKDGLKTPIEGMATYDGYVTPWVLDLLVKARRGKLSKFSSVKVAKAGGRVFARIGGTWFDTSLTARMQVTVLKRGGAASATVLRSRGELKGMLALGPSVVIALDDTRAVCFASVGLDKADAEVLGRLIPAPTTQPAGGKAGGSE